MNPRSWFSRRTTSRHPRGDQSPLRVERLEDRVTPTGSGVRSIDGTGNNLAHPTWGAAGTDLIRLSPAAYADGVSSPSLPTDPSARAVSNILNNQADPANPAADV